MNDIRDIGLAPSGELKIAWVRRNMAVLRGIEADFAAEKPFAGMKIALSVHLEAKTAYLCRVLAAGGAEMYVTGSNPLSTQDDVAAALAAGGIEVHATHGASPEEYEKQLEAVLSVGPNIIIDDGGELVELMRTKFADLLPGVHTAPQDPEGEEILLPHPQQAGDLGGQRPHAGLRRELDGIDS